jgi:putative SOS response-associated peptidase YedK
MCGRFTLKTSRAKIAELIGSLKSLPLFEPRYNIAPSQPVLAVRIEPERGEREGTMLKWGLIPSWAKEPSIGNKLANARADTVAEKPAFRSAFKKRRCLVLADGFYEWRAASGGKTPYYFQLKDGSPFAFAGLWERWEKGEEPVESCTLITTEANGVVGQVHDRMPVILDPGSYDRWLDPNEQRAEALKAMLVPLPDEWMTAHPVSKLVNNPRNEGPKCVEPAGSG